ncbi:MAG TPA: vitamin K epoxide reductase family protein [Terriglobales bacterium]
MFISIAILALAGICVSGVSLYHHFQTTKTDFCDIGQAFNCDIVNRSIYSTLFGIPVALIGILGYALIGALATIYRDRIDTPRVMWGASVLGLGFALYLTYVEGFILGTWCILCLSSLTMITLITILASAILARSMRRAT